MTDPVKDPTTYPALRNVQYLPVKQGEEQYVVLWDPAGLSAEKLIVPLNFFYLFQFYHASVSYYPLPDRNLACS